MGPQLYRCGNSSNSRAPPLRYTSFNGAATLSLRKRRLFPGYSPSRFHASMGPQLYRCGNMVNEMQTYNALLASMGPQLYRCGNKKLHDDLFTTPDKLQWGRNFIVAETLGGLPDHAHLHYASMGPQLYRCGNADNPQHIIQSGNASMGPQLYRCGNSPLRSRCHPSR